MKGKSDKTTLLNFNKEKNILEKEGGDDQSVNISFNCYLFFLRMLTHLIVYNFIESPTLQLVTLSVCVSKSDKETE